MIYCLRAVALRAFQDSDAVQLLKKGINLDCGAGCYPAELELAGCHPAPQRISDKYL
jgi:hypothetical protein